jgi:hypothetical protein
MPNYRLMLERGDGNVLEVVADDDSAVGMLPGFEFDRDGEKWRVDRVNSRTPYCKRAKPPHGKAALRRPLDPLATLAWCRLLCKAASVSAGRA